MGIAQVWRGPSVFLCRLRDNLSGMASAQQGGSSDGQVVQEVATVFDPDVKKILPES